MLTNEQIKQKWTECTRKHRRGDVISSVDMAIELARWVESECGTALAEAQAERDRLAKQVEAMKAQLGAMQECATMFVEGHGWLENADSQEDWNKGWAIIEKAKLATPELLHPTAGIDIIALRKQVSAMTEALTNIHNMAVEELRRFDDTELQGHMVWQIEADARAALAAQEGK